MKPHERRHQQAYPYYKLAFWDKHSMTFVDGRRAYGSEEEARRSCPCFGRYRISIVSEDGRQDLEPFDVN